MVLKVNKSDAGEMEIGFGPFKATLTGRLAKQAMLAGAMGYILWFGKNQVMHELRDIRYDVLKTQIAAQAIVEALPAAEQKLAKKIIDDKMAVLMLADRSSNRDRDTR